MQVTRVACARALTTTKEKIVYALFFNRSKVGVGTVFTFYFLLKVPKQVSSRLERGHLHGKNA